jgi:hypothetical protein
VAHAYNPSFSGGRDQEDCGSKPAWANSSQDPISKNPSQKRAGGVAQGVGPEFKPQYCIFINKLKTRNDSFSCTFPKAPQKATCVGTHLVMPVVRRLRWEDSEFETSLG